MKIQPQTGDALQHLGETLAPHRVAMLTLDEDAGPASRPMTPLEMGGDGAIWFMASRRSLTRPLDQSTCVNLAFVDHGRASYVSVTGRGSLVDELSRKRELWSIAGRPWFDGPDDPDLVLLRVAPLQAEIWDGPHGSLTRVLAMAASVVAGRELGLGHKETLVVAPAAARRA